MLRPKECLLAFLFNDDLFDPVVLAHLLYHVQAFYHLAEAGVLTIQVSCLLPAEHDEDPLR